MSGKNPETEQQIDSQTTQEQQAAGSNQSEQEVRDTPPNEVCRNPVTTETNSAATDSTAASSTDLTSDSLAKEPQGTQERTTATAEQVATSGATESTSAAAAPTAVSSVERQTSIGSIESGTMPGVGGGASGGSTGSGSGSGFRNSLNNGRVSFSRFISVDRTRPSNNDMLSEILTLMQQARHPGSFFSSERRGIFLPSSAGSGRSHTPGTSTPPSAAGGHSSSEVVIDVDGASAVGGTSLRSSQNELYPMSTSTSSASAGLRPFLWMQPTEDGGQMSGTANGGGGRSPLMPNFNYNHHHHHHFHNHQPLSMHQNAQSSSAVGVTIAGQSPSSTVGDIGIPSGDPQQSQSVGGGGGGGGGTPTGSTMPTVGAGATRSNSLSSNHPNDEATVHEALHQIPEARAMMDTLARYTPLLLILVAKLCYDHLDGIIYFFMLLITFYHANWVVRQEISKQKQRRLIVLLREMALIVLGLMVFGFVFEFSNIWLVVLFMPVSPQPQSLKSLLYTVCITDLILKQITIVIKIIFTLLPPTVVDYKSRGKIYLMIESLSQLYRAAAPIQPWLVFLFESYSGSEKMVGVILSAVYIVAKSTDLLDRIKFCRRSFIKLLQKTSYGTVPTKEQLQACGGQCSICHDNFNSPVLLECNHIFCELCVGTWFDREQTCPLCRAKIVDDPSYRDGATTFFLQLY
ncbi:RING finger and transmembrane domain-containing protein 2-like [Anopheles albimanus]|uniref:RING-type domain-containing protein n=1 Tax=Anopheles albimanus TaxID=7167 RepID=A0A182FP02_ANOAL|nr:RING finger and transmembrane domain-containing protein 2-like [Anopheles albimanus]XP_035773924.1 RING finger and transmembrane domain-containing protein 2-like [Anopheles albimanus]